MIDLRAEIPFLIRVAVGLMSAVIQRDEISSGSLVMVVRSWS